MLGPAARAGSLRQYAVGEAGNEGVGALLALLVARFTGARVPGGGFHGIAADATGAELGKHQRVVGLADTDLGLGAAARRGALIGGARGHDVAGPEERVAPPDQRR